MGFADLGVMFLCTDVSFMSENFQPCGIGRDLRADMCNNFNFGIPEDKQHNWMPYQQDDGELGLTFYKKTDDGEVSVALFHKTDKWWFRRRLSSQARRWWLLCRHLSQDIWWLGKCRLLLQNRQWWFNCRRLTYEGWEKCPRLWLAR